MILSRYYSSQWTSKYLSSHILNTILVIHYFVISNLKTYWLKTTLISLDLILSWVRTLCRALLGGSFAPSEVD